MKFLSARCVAIAALLSIFPSVARAQNPDSLPRPDSMPRPRPDTLVRPRPDSLLRPRPDSLPRTDSGVAPVPAPVVSAPVALTDSVRDSAATPVKSTRLKSKRNGATTAVSTRKMPVWPVPTPPPLPGSLLPKRRIIAFYGNPLSRRMGILGELEPDSMLAKLDREVAAWNKADSTTPVKPALHLIAVVAQGGPGPSGKYRLRMTDDMIEKVAKWADSRNALVFLDIQAGLSTIEDELPQFRKWLERPNFHLGIDPEFAMKRGGLPGKKIGTLDAADVNFAVDFLAKIVDEKQLAPKVLVVHRFTRPMLTNADKIKLDPRVQIVVQMDGWGSPTLKKGSYRNYVWSEPVQYTGFKLFYKNDIKGGTRMMTPDEVLKLTPAPLYIQYQ